MLGSPFSSSASSFACSSLNSEANLSGQGGGTEDFLTGGMGALLLRAAWLANTASWAACAAFGRPDTL